MEFTRKNADISLISEKKCISFQGKDISVEWLFINSAWEYEKSGFLVYVREFEWVRYVSLRAEGFWVGYISDIPTEIPADIIDFFGQLDVLLVSFSKSEQKFIEQLEPKIVVSFSPSAQDLIPLFGPEISLGNSYKMKSADISAEKTALAILSE